MNYEDFGITLCNESGFFVSVDVIDSFGNLNQYLNSRSNKFSYFHNNQLYQGKLLISHLNLPQWPQNIATPIFWIFGTPENYAITVGRLKISTQKTFNFQTARFHIGVPAQIDLNLAMRQNTQSAVIKSYFQSQPHPARQSYGLMFTREGHLSHFQEALYRSIGLTIPFTLAHVKHADHQVDNKFKRITQISKISLEGLSDKQIDTLILSDSTASGMQQVAVAEYLLKHIHHSPTQPKIKRFLVVSPMLNLWGASVFAHWAATQKIATTFMACGGLLNSVDQLHYYSALSTHRHAMVEPKLAKLHHLASGPKAAHKICVRGNWTASFLAPKEALKHSRLELKSIGSNNKIVQLANKKITLQQIQAMGINPLWLLPQSSLLEAKINHQKETLKLLNLLY